jgi:uncharacterized protein
MNVKVIQELRMLPLGRIAFAACGLIAIALSPGIAFEAAVFALRNLFSISPIILIGILLTAGVTATGSMALIALSFEGRQVRMIGVASLVGALTPVCGISVLPLVAGLLAGGVPLAPIMAFWLSSPITDPGMLAITAATLGMPFAVAKTLAAFFIGLFGGTVILVFNRLGFLLRPEKARGRADETNGRACSMDAPATIKWRFWNDKDRREAFRDTALDTGRMMIVWLSIAFVAEFFLKRFVPDELVASIVGRDSAWAVPLAALVGAPIYLDGYAALPLIRGLVESGMRADAAMTFLVAGGITSAWAAIPVFALVRLPVFVAYLALAIISSMLAGWASGWFLL